MRCYDAFDEAIADFGVTFADQCERSGSRQILA